MYISRNCTHWTFCLLTCRQTLKSLHFVILNKSLHSTERQPFRQYTCLLVRIYRQCRRLWTKNSARCPVYNVHYTFRRHAYCHIVMYWYAFVCSHTVEFTLCKVYIGLHAADMRLVSASAHWASVSCLLSSDILDSTWCQEWFIFALSEMGSKNWQNILPDNIKPHQFLTSSCNFFPFL